jgi:hypothetical protein
MENRHRVLSFCVFTHCDECNGLITLWYERFVGSAGRGHVPIRVKQTSLLELAELSTNGTRK